MDILASESNMARWKRGWNSNQAGGHTFFYKRKNQALWYIHRVRYIRFRKRIFISSTLTFFRIRTHSSPKLRDSIIKYFSWLIEFLSIFRIHPEKLSLHSLVAVSPKIGYFLSNFSIKSASEKKSCLATATHAKFHVFFMKNLILFEFNTAGSNYSKISTYIKM